ncbi:RimJ/RimL family protein N-acetyltransferase [Halopolyspora algeriensis]|uniref:Lysine N-acyltransferase MbtK n=1 Tax=Halopolyspora algeriensis TaxID=1500506 RepID=A0A368VTT0_9ACTN|nr:GNAT family N-acetyltransferase [Halopolyspora algeriensis]RCW45169.1 RimJ/RimL family protein N-acetyltransferase [Halopolyspora algeriensis]TQM53112.1 RimJ/RimL family protein N-acetyltransferase [Halopolyspora algeriensis]
MTADGTGDATVEHRRCSALLRRWLSETHTPTSPGPLRVRIGPLEVRTEIRSHSPTGAHRFGPIHTAESEDDAAGMPADPSALSAAISADARAREGEDAAINAAGAGSLAEWMRHALVEPDRDLDPVGPCARSAAFHELLKERAEHPPRLLDTITGLTEFENWLDGYVAAELLPASGGAHLSEEAATASLLTRGPLAVVGLLGRYGVADETDLLRLLSRRLQQLEHPETSRLARRWLNRPTVTDLGGLNGAGLRYRDASGAVRVVPVFHEIPNPLCAREATGPRVPGVPVPAPGEDWSLRAVEVTGDDGGPDVALVHAWMNTEHVATHWQQAWSHAQWHRELATQLGGEHSLPCLVSRGGRPVAYVELYRVVRDTLAGCYPFHPHDLGVHIAIGDPDQAGRGLGSSLLRALARGLLAADPECRRVVAEPNLHNPASIGAFGKAGYIRERDVGLPTKNSALMVYSR